MIDSESPEGGDSVQNDIAATYGPESGSADTLEISVQKKRDFKAWHHPVKQIVRLKQWAALTQKLVEDRSIKPTVLRYFTLPGPDLLDVRVLADVCQPLGVAVEYFGFDIGGDDNDPSDNEVEHMRGAWINAESALRQSGRITANAIIQPDRLEDIAVKDSQAATQLRQRPVFDVVNVDACDHLAYLPKGRTHNTFDALNALLAHQMKATLPWLLFITTRVEPSLLGNPGVAFQTAINQNLGLPDAAFRTALAECLEADPDKIASALAETWSTHNLNFLKLYSVGLGKFLLQFFCGQPNLPANVELASAYTYRVYTEEPDMIALAFRIIPDPPRTYARNCSAGVRARAGRLCSQTGAASVGY
jgi:hypothetical protein